MAAIKALRPVSNRVLLTPSFLACHQDKNPVLSSIKMHLKTKDPSKISKKMLNKYRLLNDSILVVRRDKNTPFETPGKIRIVCDVSMTLIILRFQI